MCGHFTSFQRSQINQSDSQNNSIELKTMNPMPILGREYLDHLWKIIGTKLKAAARPLFRDGIGDRMDKGKS